MDYITCKNESCKNQAVFGSDFCWDHTEDKEACRKKLEAFAREGTSLKGANLSKADLRGLELGGIDLSEAILTRADLSDSSLFDANLKNAELLGTNLSGCDLTSANLEGSDLTRSILSGARLWHANLENSNLIEANLSRSDLWNTKLYNIKLWRTNLSDAFSLSKKNFRSSQKKLATYTRINEKGVLSAEESYRDLKRYFLSNGRYDDASWASFKEKTMEKLLLKKKGNLAYLPSLVMDILCGYGERPHRIIFSSFLVILIYAFLYKFFGAIKFTEAPLYTISMGDYIYYSVITFTTVGYGDFIPKEVLFYRSLAASEAFIGTFMIGLFIFTLARKFSAR